MGVVYSPTKARVSAPTLSGPADSWAALYAPPIPSVGAAPEGESFLVVTEAVASA